MASESFAVALTSNNKDLRNTPHKSSLVAATESFADLFRSKVTTTHWDFFHACFLDAALRSSLRQNVTSLDGDLDKVSRAIFPLHWFRAATSLTITSYNNRDTDATASDSTVHLAVYDDSLEVT